MDGVTEAGNGVLVLENLVGVKNRMRSLGELTEAVTLGELIGIVTLGE